MKATSTPRDKIFCFADRIGLWATPFTLALIVSAVLAAKLLGFLLVGEWGSWERAALIGTGLNALYFSWPQIRALRLRAAWSALRGEAIQ
jgi:hypothetical protein